MAGSAAIYSGKNIKIQNAANNEQVDISIFGEITSGSWWDEKDTLTDVLDSVRSVSDGKKVTYNIEIASPGGDVNVALTLYDIFSSLKGKVITTVYGMTASSGTILAQAASKGNRKIGVSAVYLIHKVSSGIWGNENDLEAALEMHKTLNNTLAEIYATKSTKKTKEEFLELMNRDNGNGIFLSAKEALEWGLVDEIVQGASLSNSTIQNFNEFAEKNKLIIYNKKEERMDLFGLVKGFFARIGKSVDDADEAGLATQFDAHVAELEAKEEAAKKAIANALKPFEAKVSALEIELSNAKGEATATAKALEVSNKLLEDVKAEKEALATKLEEATKANELLAAATKTPPTVFNQVPPTTKKSSETLTLAEAMNNLKNEIKDGN